MSTNTIYLISGANRGIGRGLTAAYLSRDNTTIIAAVRDLSHATSQSLASLPKGKDSTLIVVKIDSLSHSDPAAAIATLPAHSIPHIDVLIANAGVLEVNRVTDITVAEYRYHQDVNTIGPLLLLQAAWELLQKAPRPKFVVVASQLGSVAVGPKAALASGSYGASKASINYLLRKLHFENPGLIALPICPGMTQTDMGAHVATAMGREKATVTLEDSVKGVVQEIDNATRTADGRFASYQHVDLPW
ncbi:NAD(P)-binding protein [Mytilinidion resinicola]|uniref:NAD(P)-binding protein n=1 Tax=Mytilinidion resinicola TaxID=574789 RepID=A0A6A6YJT6_9PEZI|nr:NAD(P)-binding protein [Mytilinidion resinicola]KAF2808793.1 NAD(P)-binding protein [Mytilinidion resinicola]